MLVNQGTATVTLQTIQTVTHLATPVDEARETRDMVFLSPGRTKGLFD